MEEKQNIRGGAAPASSGVVGNKSLDDLLQDVQQRFDRLRAIAHGLSQTPGVVNYASLEIALREHYPLLLDLIDLLARVTAEYKRAEEAFDQWYAEEYTKLRQEVNGASLPASKWLSNRDIDYLLRSRGPAYHEQKAYLNRLEVTKAFVEQLYRSWEGNRFILTALSKAADGVVAGGGS